jgi:hypothetical protein
MFVLSLGLWVKTEEKSYIPLFPAQPANVGKTKVMIFHTPGKQIPANINHIYNDNKPTHFNLNKIHQIHQVERYHTNHPNPQCHSDELLGMVPG